ncbi:hypothetical protein [Bacillus phage CP-51]|uniref:Uncharacterized protein n=1 Tax=Bacillus phage CP-51 TaxID=1391188 RepID=A0A068EU85_9CAUD|nr:hypothetical protein OZ73_gp151 [Bacillus phage CP-51]AID50586.1 hypothetical protein [Bacillus phage CP-51]
MHKSIGRVTESIRILTHRHMNIEIGEDL